MKHTLKSLFEKNMQTFWEILSKPEIAFWSIERLQLERGSIVLHITKWKCAFDGIIVN
jgi:hypothetical protein